jgi:HK97 family phage prohead protease
MTTSPIIETPDGRPTPDNAERVMRSAWKDANALPDQLFKESTGVIVNRASEEQIRASRTIRFRVTSPTPDRAYGGGDVVYPMGGNFDNFVKSPVILWSHSHFTPPIAKGSNITADDSGVFMDKTFIEEEVSPFANSLFEMLVRGYLNACSIGFRPIVWGWNEERGSWAIDYMKWELLESSICAVGMNPDALQVARSVGINLAPLREFAEQVLEEELRAGGDAAQKRLHERFIKHSTGRGASVLNTPVRIELSDELKAALDAHREGIEGQIKALGDKFEAAGGSQNKADEGTGIDAPPEANKAADPSEDGVIIIMQDEE